MRISRNGIRKLFLTAFLVMTVMVPLTGQASTLLGTYSTGSNFDSGGCFGRWFNRGIGINYRAANVQLAGHDMRYASSDHNITRSSMRITHVSYNSTTGNVSFYVSGCFHDKNPSDDIYWQAYYTIVADQW